MDRLSIFLTFATGPVLTGIVIVSLFSLGLYSAPAVLAGVAAGLLLAWPAAYLVSRRIKRADPDWDHTKAGDHASPLPRPDAPEV
jgi:xanthine/uracil permease